MLHQLKLFAVLLLLISNLYYPQTIRSVETKGNQYFGSSQIIEWSGIKTRVLYSDSLLDSAKFRIARQLGQFGYFNSNFDDFRAEYSEDSSQVDVILNIKEGSPAILNRIIISDPDSLPKTILSPFYFLEGQIYNKFELEETISEALTFLENNGYPFSKILISSIFPYKDSLSEDYFIDITLKFDNGFQSRIDRIEIEGNESTKSYVIVRELRLEPEESYSQNRIEELPARLNKLRFFEPVQTPEFILNSENKGILLIKVKEKNTNFFDGIIGYIPGNKEGEKGYVTGLVNVSLRNLFGTGRAAAVRWQQFDRFSQELELKYLEPWIFSYPFNINGSFFQRKQDTTYVIRRVDGNVEFLATEDISAALLIGSESVIPTIPSVPRFTVYNSASLTTGANLKIDTRDDPYAPTRGILFLNSYTFSRKKIYGPKEYFLPGMQTSINLQRFTLDFNYYIEIFTKQIIAAAVHGRELRGIFFEESDLFRLGGTTTLRGYRENQFVGSRTFWSNLEYRLLLTRRSFAFAFFDTGYYLRNADPDRNIEKQEGFNMGYGVGLNLETGLGILGVSYALGKGDNFKDGKIHFGIINEF